MNPHADALKHCEKMKDSAGNYYTKEIEKNIAGMQDQEQRIKVAAPRQAPSYGPASPQPSQYGQPRAYAGARAAFTAFQ